MILLVRVDKPQPLLKQKGLNKVLTGQTESKGEGGYDIGWLGVRSNQADSEWGEAGVQSVGVAFVRCYKGKASKNPLGSHQC